MSDCESKEKKDCKKKNNCSWKKRTNKCSSIRPIATRKNRTAITENESLVEETSELLEHNPSIESKINEEIQEPTDMSPEWEYESEASVATEHHIKNDSGSESSSKIQCILISTEPRVAQDIISETPDQERLRLLTEQFERCKKECDEINKTRKQLEDVVIQKTIEGITIDHKKKLIDLLIERVLDPSPEWKQKIDTLINIPTGLVGDNLLRGGDYFEAIFQLAIAIGVLPQYKDKFVRFYDIHDYKHKKEYPNYIYDKTIQNSGGKEHGISDITFEVSDNILFDATTINKGYKCGYPPPLEVQSTNPFYFISVKGYKKEKSIKDEYDIPLLDQQLKLFPKLNKHIMVCVRNKRQFLDKLSRSKMDFLKHSIHFIIGYDEVIEAFTQFRLSFFRRIECITPERIDEEVRKLFPKDVIHKQPLQMYFHQELVVETVKDRIKEIGVPVKPHFMCIGVLPRGGKSFIAGGIITAHKKIKGKEGGYNVLFMTSAVNETRGQFKTDLIEKFSDFDDFQFVDVVKENTNDPTKPNKFYFISRQLSSMRVIPEGSEEKSEDILKGMFEVLESKLGILPEIDIIFFDEAHIGITSRTIRSNFQAAFDRFREPVPVVLMTATYKKPAIFLDSNKDLFIWDLQDIKDMKSLPVLKFDGFVKNNPDLLERYSEEALKLLENRIRLGESLESIAKPYLQFPIPNFISLTFSPDEIKHLKDTKGRYKFTTAFELNDNTDMLLDNIQYDRWGSLLRNRDHALRLRQFLTPEQDLSNEDERELAPFLQNGQRKYRALNQIFSIAQKNGSRPMVGKPFSILMFLPFNFEGGSPIGELCRVWGSFMLESKYWRENFVFLTLSTYNNPNYRKDPHITLESAVAKGLCHREDFTDELKDIIINVEKEALKQGKGLVILSGDVAKMGISLKCVDVVFMMSSSTDADDIIQKMYRALTDDPPYKKDGFIVDLDLKRIVNAMFEYDLEKDKMRIKNPVLPSVAERLEKVWELCNWGQDMFIEENTDMDFNTIMDQIKQRVLDDLAHKILDGTDKMYSHFDLDKNQLESIRMDDELYNEIKDTLQYTYVKKKLNSKQTAETLRVRGEHIPAGEEPSKTLTGPTNHLVDNLTDSLLVLNIQEIEQKMIRIIKTFVNALVIKSTESWSGSLNLISLLDKYKKDKQLIADKGYSLTIRNCNCISFDDCMKEHDNIYETVFCELSSYAMIKESIRSKEYRYNQDIHMKIIIMVERVFEKSEFLLQWNHYIEELLRTVKTAKKFGGKKTIKKCRYYIKTNASRRFITKI